MPDIVGSDYQDACEPDVLESMEINIDDLGEDGNQLDAALIAAVNETAQDGVCREIVYSEKEYEGLYGLMGTCVTQVLDRDRINEIKYVVSTSGNIVFIDGSIKLINPEGHLVIRAKCIIPGGCNLADASIPARKIELGDFEILPEGAPTVLSKPIDSNGRIEIRIVDGTGDLHVFHKDAYLGTISAPTTEEQENGVETVGELDTQQIQFGIKEQIEMTHGVDDKSCNASILKGNSADLSSPSFMITALLFLIATKFAREGANGIEKAQEVARDLAQRIFGKLDKD